MGRGVSNGLSSVSRPWAVEERLLWVWSNWYIFPIFFQTATNVTWTADASSFLELVEEGHANHLRITSHWFSPAMFGIHLGVHFLPADRHFGWAQPRWRPTFLVFICPNWGSNTRTPVVAWSTDKTSRSRKKASNISWKLSEVTCAKGHYLGSPKKMS